MANPSLPYLPELMSETEEEYEEWKKHPEQNGDFLTKRFGIRRTLKEIAVTDYENVRATNRELPDLSGRSCVCGIDYASLSDWASVNLHFVEGEERLDLNHSWICLKSRDLSRIKAPWQDWAKKGYITLVDDVSIHPDIIAEYIARAGQVYMIEGVAMDNYRYALLENSLRNVGFDAGERKNIKLVRPQDIMKAEPVIQECFSRKLFSWGDNPPLRWAVQNTKRVRASRQTGSDTGNFYYAKIEAKSRKTDPFMGLVASMVIESKLGGGEQAGPPPMGAIVI